ncbi:hypothetical protein D3C81_1418640 [compost metagenome]
MEHGRQQAAIVVLEQRHIRHHRTVLEHGIGNLDLGRQAHLRVLVRRVPWVMAGRRQQAAVTVRRAGVKFEAEHAQRIHAKTYRPLGITRLHIEDETLCPFFAFGRTLAGTAVAVTKIPVEIDIACFDLCTAVFKKTGGLGIDAGTQQEQAGNTTPGGEGERGKHGRKHPESRRVNNLWHVLATVLRGGRTIAGHHLKLSREGSGTGHWTMV